MSYDPHANPPPGYGSGPQQPPPSWWASIPWWIRGLVAALLVLGIQVLWKQANPENQVYVSCQPGLTEFQCSVEHRRGNDEINACWDLALICQSGERQSAHACQVVHSGATVVRPVPVSEFRNFAACQATAAHVENLVLTAQ